MDAEPYFSTLTSLYAEERIEEEKQFAIALTSLSIQQQATAGLCWHPLQVIETGYGFGDYPFVWVERTKLRDSPHSFSPGKPVRIFSASQGDSDAVTGVLDALRDNRAKIVFFRDELPDILDEGRLVMQAQFDALAYKRCNEALEGIKNARNCRLAHLRDVLIQKKAADTHPNEVFVYATDEQLNPSQNLAAKLITETRDVAVVHGPPGTGKTTTLVSAAVQICRQEGRILFSAPSNAAVDHLCSNLLAEGLNVVRIGNPVRVSEQLEAITVEGKIRNSPEFSVIREARKQADAYRTMALKYKRSFGAAEREQRNLLLKEAKSLLRDANQLERTLSDAVFHSADVVCGTLMAVHTHLPKDIAFDFVFIDEAAQALEPLSWLPLIRAERFVLAGDPHQLPPTVKSHKAAKDGLGITLMEKVLNHVPTVLLNVQYRMNPHIMAFPNRWFYEDKLRGHESTLTRFPKNGNGLLFIDTAGAGYEEEFNTETQSISNPGEAAFLQTHWNVFLPEDTDMASVALISPYNEQVRMLTDQFEGESTGNTKIRIRTIDSFQGQESDCVIISLVRSNERREIGFLRDYRRMNVAMTRARYQLIMLGDSATLSADPFYDALINWCIEGNMYRSVWEIFA